MSLRGRTFIAVAVVLWALALSAPVRADNGGRRGEGGEGGDRFRAPTADQREFIRQRREQRREDGPAAGESMRERWQQLAPEEREQIRAQRRNFRQLSPEERQQLRRDVLEANRGGRGERWR